MFCSKCGNQLEPNTRFCGNCGSATTQSPATETGFREFFPATTESVVLVLSMQRKTSIFKRVGCYIVFMTDKVVFAHLSSQLQKAESAKAAQSARDNGLGFFKGSAAMMKYWSSYHEKYYSMSTAQILSEDPSNFSIPYQNIKKVLFKCESSSIDSDGSSYGSGGSLQFTLFDGKTIKFAHNRGHDKSVHKTLTMLFPDKLKYRK